MKLAKVIILTLATVLVPAASPLLAMSPEPTGFQQLKFGVSVDEARKVYPSMEKAEQSKVGPKANYPAKVTRFFVAKQKVEGLEKPTDIELLFWDGKFWIAMVKFGDNEQAKVEEALKQRYGKPDYDGDPYLSWTGKTAAVLADRKVKYYEVHDETISNQARREIFGSMLSSGTLLTPNTPAPTAAGSPGTAAAAPAAATPAAAPATPAKQ